jgi:uncharacterized protein YbaA (DUF1428 family)
MAKYVDGFVIPIKKANLAAYKKMAKIGRDVWMGYGALDYVESVGDQIDGAFAPSFKQMCKLKANETAIFAYVVYKSKADRNRINKLVMKDPRMQPGPKTKMPFDMKRFAMGGFSVIVTA